ncbi:MAG: flagellar hook-associated protein FlgL [Lautropia sp.]|nr:flagellar hook-associated protein FlgL [Lautropia sp.]
MRIATNQYRNQAVSSMLEHQSELARLQEQASTGHRVNRASDDPLAVAEAERLRSAQARLDIEKRMMSYARNLMAQSEGVLDNAILSVQSARDTIIESGNAIRSESDRKSLAEKISALRNELLTLANHQDHEGGYLFGGPGADRQPFSPTQAPAYQVAPGERQTGLNVSFLVSLDGSKVFGGFGADGQQTIFQELDEVIGALEDPNIGQDRLMGTLQEGMRSVDQTLNRMNTARSSLGEQMRILDSRERVIGSGELSTARRRSELMDTDYASVLSDTQSRTVALQAAMQTYTQVSQLSLFNYL